MNSWISYWLGRNEEPAGHSADSLGKRLRAKAGDMLPEVGPLLHRRVMQAVAAARAAEPASSRPLRLSWLVPAMGLAAVLAAVVMFHHSADRNQNVADAASSPALAPAPALPGLPLPDSAALVQDWLVAPYQKELSDLSADAQAVLDMLPIKLARM